MQHSFPIQAQSTLLLAAFLFVSGCGPDDVYTLYRASPLSHSMRIHMATFDADDAGADYNRENCAIAARLFMAQPGVTVRYWCEAGRYRE